MKLKIYTLLLALCVTWSLQSCDNDDDNSIAVPTELQNAFASKYPNAANVKWETKSGYYVADFYDEYEASAWLPKMEMANDRNRHSLQCITASCENFF